MKVRSIKLFSLGALLAVSTSAHADSKDVYGKSFYLGNNGAVTANGVMLSINKQRDKSDKKAHGYLWAQVEGGQTFKSSSIASALFFNGSSSMSIGQAGNNSATDIYSTVLLLPQADRGEPQAWQSTISAAPQISTIVADFRGIFFLQDWEKWYFEFDIPVVNSRFNMNLSEQPGPQTVTTLLGGAVIAPYTNAIDAFAGGPVTIPFNNVQVSLNRLYGNINGVQKKTVVGDAKLALGRRLMDEEQGYVGLALLGVINGDDKSATDVLYLGTPSVGTAGRCGLGVRLDGFYELYAHNNSSIAFDIRADVFHTFKSTITRSYDVDNHGVGSRYLLVRGFTSAYAYSNVMTFITNLTTLRAKINIPCVYDITMMFQAKHKQMDFDLGLQIHGHAKEKHKGWVDTTLPAGNWGVGYVGDGTTSNLSPDISISGAQANNAAPTTTAASAATVLNIEALNIGSALANSSISCRVFTAFGYTLDHKNKPYFLAGAGVELPNCNSAPYQWEVHSAVGFHF